MVAGIGSWGPGSYFAGPWGKVFIVVIPAIEIFRHAFPEIKYTPDDSRFSWAASNGNGLLNERSARIAGDLYHQVHREPIANDWWPDPDPDPEPDPDSRPDPRPDPGPDPDPGLGPGLGLGLGFGLGLGLGIGLGPEVDSETEQKPEIQETGPKPIPYGDHSLWDLAGKTLSSWLRGLCINGINLDPKVVRTVVDAATIAGGFGAMLFIFYLAKREPKTDYYHLTRVAVPPPAEASRKPHSNRLLELEAALLKLKSTSLKEPT